VNASASSPDAIVRYLALEAPPRWADLAFVFGTRYYAVTYEPPGIPRTGWERAPAAAQRVHKECEAISRYLAAGDIAAVRREGDAYV
jgi:hypothetical protein